MEDKWIMDEHGEKCLDYCEECTKCQIWEAYEKGKLEERKEIVELIDEEIRLGNIALNTKDKELKGFYRLMINQFIHFKQKIKEKKQDAS